MRIDDMLLLESLEDIHHVIEQSLKKISKIRSVHVHHFEEWAEEVRNHRRIFEEISIPARLIIEHLMHCRHKSGQVSLETGQISSAFSSIGSIKVEPFGIIKIKCGELETSWRDSNYSYYFYPDKVELRAIDEKSAIKILFTYAFTQQIVEKFPELIRCPNVAYIHPQLEQWSRQV
ncbi:MAG TPA: hypothetical protein GX523_05150 [Desulfitobacterium dehalogenans]|uniref:Uncharacterized protein n=1 Tax=Desulfitobacterium dehalogenans TaxID=36854 RepID=A0A7C7D4M7_9FIRM|nr:hypothetical protein [Desulfitobacterium dehalogenans]